MHHFPKWCKIAPSFRGGIFQLVVLEAKIASGVYGSWKSAVPITP